MFMRRRKATKAWIKNTDPIRLMIYYILIHVRYLVIVLVIYIFALTVSDILFTIENTGGVAKGGYYWERQNPKLCWCWPCYG